MRTRDLTAAQLWLVRLMQDHQFGRIENLRVERGIPVPDATVRVVRVTHLGGGNAGRAEPESVDFEVKRAVTDLFAELARLPDGTVVQIEFRRGLPCRLEVARAPV